MMPSEGVPPQPAGAIDTLNTLVTWAAPAQDAYKGIPAGTLCRVLEPADDEGYVTVSAPDGTETWMPVGDLRVSEHDAAEKEALALKQRAEDMLAKLPHRAPVAAPARTVTVDDPATGHALGKVLRMLGAVACVVSTPETGPTVAGEAPFDAVPVMSALERAASFVADNLLVPFYDFAGSASKADCAAQVPDNGALEGLERDGLPALKYRDYPDGSHGLDWGDKATVDATQWMRYWCGGVRAGLKGALLGMARPLPGEPC